MKITHSLLWIIGSVLLIPGVVWKTMSEMKKESVPEYVCRVVQTGPRKGAVRSAYLAELMGLSADRPVEVGGVNGEEMERRVRRCPVVKEAKVKVEGETVFVDYTVRKPVVLVGDFENMGMDEEGVVFPMSPFFSPKKLPEVYLGVGGVRWGDKVGGYRVELAMKLVGGMRGWSGVKRVDVSRAFVGSLGAREVVVVIEEDGVEKTLRVTPKGFAQEMGNYRALKGVTGKAQVIDLRIPKLAFIEEK